MKIPLTILEKKGIANLPVNWEKIERDKKRYFHLMNSDANPREKFHLDTTKIAFHNSRVQAYLQGKIIAPITIDMALTQRCSLNCVYCYANLQENPSSPLEWRHYQALLDDLVEIGHEKGEGVKAVSLVSDGESTENPYFADFILYGKERGIDMAVGTNGLLLNQFPLEKILPALTYLRFNISAAEPDAYKQVMGVNEVAYRRVISNIEECVRIKREKSLPVTLGLQMVLIPQFADQIIPLAVLGRNLGVDYTVIKHCSDDEQGSLGVDYSWYKTERAQQLLRTAESLSTKDYSVQAKWSKINTGKDRKYPRCFGAPFIMQMSGSGLVAPCGPFFGTEYSRYHIGNYGQQRFKDIWAGGRYWNVMNSLSSERFDARTQCASLCLQDKVNEALYDLIVNKKPLPDVSGKPKPQHINFI